MLIERKRTKGEDGMKLYEVTMNVYEDFSEKAGDFSGGFIGIFDSLDKVKQALEDVHSMVSENRKSITPLTESNLYPNVYRFDDERNRYFFTVEERELNKCEIL